MDEKEYKELKIWMKRMENRVNSHFNYLQMKINNIGSITESKVGYIEHQLEKYIPYLWKVLNQLGIKDEEGDEF